MGRIPPGMPKGTQVTKNSENAKDPWNPQNTKNAKDPRHPQNTKNTKDPKNAQDPKNTRDPQNPKESSYLVAVAPRCSDSTLKGPQPASSSAPRGQKQRRLLAQKMSLGYQASPSQVPMPVRSPSHTSLCM